MSNNSSNDSYIDHGNYLLTNIYIFVEDVDENIIDNPNSKSKDLQYLKSGGGGRPISMLVNGAVY